MPNSNQSSEEMNYDIVGDDEQSTGDKLKKYTGIVDWEYLKPHYKSGALIYVDPSLNITEVGQAVSDDDKDKIAAWLKSGDLVKPSDPHEQWWEENPQDFTALVVSPFVLMQPVSPDESK